MLTQSFLHLGTRDRNDYVLCIFLFSLNYNFHIIHDATLFLLFQKTNLHKFDFASK